MTREWFALVRKGHEKNMVYGYLGDAVDAFWQSRDQANTRLAGPFHSLKQAARVEWVDVNKPASPIPSVCSSNG